MRTRILLMPLAAALLVGCASVTSTPPADINLQQRIIPKGSVGRRIEFPLRPTYITIHSTQNRGGTAKQHASGMLNGAYRGRSKWNRTGYLTWHFTVDDREAIQSLPLDIQGEHADHDGPGNRTSIAIEICEFSEPRRQRAAIERTARLTAWLRKRFRIQVDHVVPHYHWPQHHFHSYQKNCPIILLDNGRPGPKWQEYLNLVARS